MSTTPVDEVFFDYGCPWCYLGTVRIDRLQREAPFIFDGGSGRSLEYALTLQLWR